MHEQGSPAGVYEMASGCMCHQPIQYVNMCMRIMIKHSSMLVAALSPHIVHSHMRITEKGMVQPTLLFDHPSALKAARPKDANLASVTAHDHFPCSACRGAAAWSVA